MKTANMDEPGVEGNMLDWHDIRNRLRQLFSPEYTWGVGGICEGKRTVTVKKDERSAVMEIDAKLLFSDISYLGDKLLDKLHGE